MRCIRCDKEVNYHVEIKQSKGTRIVFVSTIALDFCPIHYPNFVARLDDFLQETTTQDIQELLNETY